MAAFSNCGRVAGFGDGSGAGMFADCDDVAEFRHGDCLVPIVHRGSDRVGSGMATLEDDVETVLDEKCAAVLEEQDASGGGPVSRQDTMPGDRAGRGAGL